MGKPELSDLHIFELLSDLTRLEDEMEQVGYVPEALNEKDAEFGSFMETHRDELEAAALHLEVELSQDESVRQITFIPVEALGEYDEEKLMQIYKKVRIVGKLFAELEKYNLAEPYLFVAYKINQFYNQYSGTPMLYDTNVLLCLAETFLMTVKSPQHGEVNERIQKYVNDFRAYLYKEIFQYAETGYEENLDRQHGPGLPLSYRRLLEATGLMFIVLAQKPKDSSGHEVMAQVQWELAREYLRITQDEHGKNLFKLNEKDIAAAEFSYEEARTYAQNAAMYAFRERVEEEGEKIVNIEAPDYVLYAAITRDYATFLSNVGKAKKGGALIQELITQEIEPLKAIIAGVENIIPFIEEHRIYRNEMFAYVQEDPSDTNTEDYRKAQNSYLQLRTTAETYLRIVVEKVKYRLQVATDDEKDALFKAYYWYGIMAAGDRLKEQAQRYLGFMSQLFDSDNENYAPYFEALQEKIAENSTWANGAERPQA